MLNYGFKVKLSPAFYAKLTAHIYWPSAKIIVSGSSEKFVSILVVMFYFWKNKMMFDWKNMIKTAIMHKVRNPPAPVLYESSPLKLRWISLPNRSNY